MYEQEINQGQPKPNCQKSKTMVMIRTTNFKVRNDRIDTGVLVKTQKQEARRMLPVESKRTVFKRRCLQYPSRRQ